MPQLESGNWRSLLSPAARIFGQRSPNEDICDNEIRRMNREIQRQGSISILADVPSRMGTLLVLTIARATSGV
jgi:hypothetical protein